MDDRVDHGIHRQVLGRSQRRELLGVPQQHVQELVADRGLHLRFGAAVVAEEGQIDEQARPRLARDGECRHAVGTLDRQHFQHGADSQWVLVDQFPVDVAKGLGVHA